MINTITAILFFVFLTGFIISVPDNNMNKFKWMSGSWKMIREKGMILESWIVLNDSSMQGRSIFINKRDTTLLETVSLVYRNNSYYYIPVVNRQNDNKPVSFIITSFDENFFVAENPNHDFPKRITYQLITKDSLHAIIDGGPSLPEKKSDFYYSSVKN